MEEDLTCFGGTVKAVTLQEPEQKTFDGQPFPLIISPANENAFKDFVEVHKWIVEKKADLKNLLQKYAVVVFRDFPLKETLDFDGFVKALDYKPFPYIGGAAPRTRVAGDVFTTNESPPDKLVDFHHEIAQSPKFPGAVFFYCEYPAKKGGQTAVAPSNVVYRTMFEREPDFVRDLEAKGIRYVRVLPDGDDNDSAIGRSWQSTYLSETREQAEAVAHELGTSFEWLPDGSVKTVTDVVPAIRTNATNGKKMWHNSIINAYRAYNDSRNTGETSIYMSDGTFMKPKIMDVLDRTLAECAIDMLWKAGDVMWIDNHQALHARRAFVPPRRVLAWLCI